MRLADVRSVHNHDLFTMTSSPMLQFSTKALAKRERLSAWREVFGHAVCSLDIEPLEPATFSSEAAIYRVPGLGVMFAASDAVNLTHTNELIVDDDISFMAAPTCNFTASQIGRTTDLEAGAGVLMTNAEVGSIRLASCSRFITFRLPRDGIAPLVPDIDAAVARRIPADNVTLRLLVDYLRSSHDTHALRTPTLQQTVATHINDLLAITLGATRDATEIAYGRGMRAARLRAAKALIMRQSSRHDLSVKRVAAQLGITPRYVHMLFETDGISLTRFIVEQRLARAYQMLLDPRNAERTISSIAFSVGFNDLSHFNRGFRAHYGKTPSDARHELG
jgi:AraC-like DNA-binding protein